MSLLCWLANGTQNGNSNPSKTINTVVTTMMIVMLVLAIYLAIRDMSFLPSVTTKMAILALAILYPDLYILLHWISTSTTNVPFLSGAPMTPLSYGPSASSSPFDLSLVADGSSSPEATLQSSMAEPLSSMSSDMP